MGTFGQASASTAVSLTLPRHALHTPWSLLLEKPPLKGEFSSLIITWVLGACTALLTHPVEGSECVNLAGMHCLGVTSCPSLQWLVKFSHLYVVLVGLLTVSEQPVKKNPQIS